MNVPREKFTYSLANREGIRKPDPDRSEVPAVKYGNGLIIHSALSNHSRGLKTDYYWTVAHEATGYGIVFDVPKRIARFVAGVLAELPVDWSAKTQADFFAAFNSLPNDVKELVHRIRKADYSKAA